MDDSRIIQIPLPGGSGRVPTGAIQFQDDWPGLFIRGDDALVLMARIRYLAKRLSPQSDPGIISVIFSLSKLADLIGRSVKVPGEKSGEGFLRTAGALADDTEWDAIMEEIYRARKIERRPQFPDQGES